MAGLNSERLFRAGAHFAGKRATTRGPLQAPAATRKFTRPGRFAPTLRPRHGRDYLFVVARAAKVLMRDCASRAQLLVGRVGRIASKVSARRTMRACSGSVALKALRVSVTFIISWCMYMPGKRSFIAGICGHDLYLFADALPPSTLSVSAAGFLGCGRSNAVLCPHRAGSR